MTALVRNPSGNVAHREGCRHTRQSHSVMVRWAWAEGRSTEEIARIATAAGIHGCRTCKPFEDPQ